ncbi:hypothetical protein D3C81_198700 [compost metagenome]
MKQIKKLAETSLVVLAEIQKAVREVAKKSRNSVLYKEAPSVYVPDLEKAADLKSKIDVMEQQLKVLYAEYEPIKESIVASLPGTKQDQIEVMIDGIQLKTWPTVRGAGVLDQEKAAELAKKKKILGRVSKKITVIDENALTAAVVEGVITENEYAACLTEGKVSQNVKISRKFTPTEAKKQEESAAV